MSIRIATFFALIGRSAMLSDLARIVRPDARQNKANKIGANCKRGGILAQRTWIAADLS